MLSKARLQQQQGQGQGQQGQGQGQQQIELKQEPSSTPQHEEGQPIAGAHVCETDKEVLPEANGGGEAANKSTGEEGGSGEAKTEAGAAVLPPTEKAVGATATAAVLPQLSTKSEDSKLPQLLSDAKDLQEQLEEW